MKFSSFNLKKELLEILENKGYINCKPIQELTLKASLRKESFIAKAETGSGKTHAYIVPLINNLNYSLNKIQAIILEPTIELTMQVGEFLKELVSNTLNFYPCILTGSNVLFDEKSLTRPSILVTTPGKLVQLLKNNSLSLKFGFSMVLDECDMFFEGDSKEDMNIIFSNFEPEQLMIFTATMKDHLIASIKKTYHLNHYFQADKNYVSKTVRHHLVDIKHVDPLSALKAFIKIRQPYFCLVFASRVQTASRVYQNLYEEGYKVALLTSKTTLRERKNIFKRINDGEYSLLICSDVASRGLDLDFVSDVVSLDIPSNIDYYYHRAGRTGRNDKEGDSFVFYNDDVAKKDKENLIKKIDFDYYVLKENSLSKDKKRNKQPKKRNEALEKEIKKAVSKVRSNKVKPNYKKKMRMAAEKAEKKHKREIIAQNLRSKKKAMAAVNKK